MHKTVHNITGAPTSHKEDVHSREVRYLWSMGVRTACFIGALVTDGVLRWLLIVAALFLPYVAVIIANAGRDTGRHAPPSYLPAAGRELPGSRLEEPNFEGKSRNEKTQSPD